MHHKQKYIYVGVDTHKSVHVAVVINCWNEKLFEVTVENKPSQFVLLLEQIRGFKKKGISVVFGLEDVGGNGRSLALFLVENKQIVKEVNSALSYSQRRSNPNIKKDDYWDAYCIANVLLAKLDELPDANPQDIYWTIGQLATRRMALVDDIISLKNQLHTQLVYHYPSYNKFFSSIDTKTALEFWEKYPSPNTLEKETVEKLKDFLIKASHNYYSKDKAEEILMYVKKDGTTIKNYQEQRDFLIKSIVRDIKFKMKEINQIEEEQEKVLENIEYKLTTIPYVNTVTASTIIAEIGDIKRFDSADKLAKFAGIAPSSFGSGGKITNKSSNQGSRQLYSAFQYMAIQQIRVQQKSKEPRNPIVYEYYNRKIAEGKTKGQAIKCVMRRMINVVFAMMRDKSEYRMGT